MTTEQQTPEAKAEAQVLALAEMMAACPLAPAIDEDPCPDYCSCKGSGEVPRFEGLRILAQDCDCVWSMRTRDGYYADPCSECSEFSYNTPTATQGWELAIELHSPNCNRCDRQGRGWLPLPVAEAAGKIRQMKGFQEWLIYGRDWIGLEKFVLMICDDHAVIAAAAAWAESCP